MESEPAAAAPTEKSPLSKRAEKKKAREERWPKKRRWADAFLEQIEAVHPEGTNLKTPATQSEQMAENQSGDAAAGEPDAKKPKRKHKSPKALHETLPDLKAHPAIVYLTQWKKDRAAWSFKKNRQSWLLDHMYHRDLVDKKRFKLLLEYIQAMQGKRRQELIDEANTFIKEYEVQLAEKNAKQLAGTAATEEEDAEWTSKTAKYKRCRMVENELSTNVKK